MSAKSGESIAGAAPKGAVFDIERFAIYDGPGIRTTVFFKGCPLRCGWCQNPEGMNPHPEILYYEHLCANCGRCAEVCPNHAHRFAQDRHAFTRERCKACGLCARECAAAALRLAGREVTVGEVMEVVLRDRAFYEKSGGGLTLSGGEPMAQPEFAEALLSAARAEGLHTAVDTSGFAPWESFERIRPLVDLFLYDVKDTDESRHLEYTGVPLAPILDNLRRLNAAGARILIRAVMVPGVNDGPSHVGKLSRLAESLANCAGIDTLQWHNLGLAKWRALGKGDIARDFSRRGARRAPA